MDAADTDSLDHARYQRSNTYERGWVIENEMGPNALWLLESLTEVMPIDEGAKVLDLGCGRAMTSIFLAREHGARVWATDLWIAAADNQRRVAEAGLTDLITPIHAEAHTLPFATGFFDAVISIDAYHYFGTDDLYLGYLADFVRPGGRIGMVALEGLAPLQRPDRTRPHRLAARRRQQHPRDARRRPGPPPRLHPHHRHLHRLSGCQ
jgi:cyclopropane fatty-acyl-phospholipid synthase-like methyltransferase